MVLLVPVSVISEPGSQQIAVIRIQLQLRFRPGAILLGVLPFDESFSLPKTTGMGRCSRRHARYGRDGPLVVGARVDHLACDRIDTEVDAFAARAGRFDVVAVSSRSIR